MGLSVLKTRVIGIVGWKSSPHPHLTVDFQVALLAASAYAAPQFQGDSSLARILQEQRFNMGDGKFGSAFAQEDGTISKEESTGNNERIGQYSYIDDTGKTITVKYSAGVNGFR